ncbi:small multidrug efflux protein [Schumannella sp. 10F1B-5-1]|uniref:small multidrug efflux protein n=1 Tax=Schumannella sp. 10F1B-5-1 TaxID=2590780 RepID=UPI001131B8F5|nr:small multidrug efflux protein [Schumannella sp. 10F1B-5-1]TPW78415.1 small multidrug efflux protein [Schumannella sp. 10F1B-5-1]
MSILDALQSAADTVPLLLQPVIVAAAGAIPFVDAELATVIGVLAGLPPLVAGSTAAAGNLLSVAAVVVFGERVRAVWRARRAARRELADADARSETSAASPGAGSDSARDDDRVESSSRRRFRGYLERFGVPVACLLGPLALPAQFTSMILVGAGVPRRRILIWQAVSIVLWTTAICLAATGALAVLGGG